MMTDVTFPISPMYPHSVMTRPCPCRHPTRCWGSEDAYSGNKITALGSWDYNGARGLDPASPLLPFGQIKARIYREVVQLLTMIDQSSIEHLQWASRRYLETPGIDRDTSLPLSALRPHTLSRHDTLTMAFYAMSHRHWTFAMYRKCASAAEMLCSRSGQHLLRG